MTTPEVQDPEENNPEEVNQVVQDMNPSKELMLFGFRLSLPTMVSIIASWLLLPRFNEAYEDVTSMALLRMVGIVDAIFSFFWLFSLAAMILAIIWLQVSKKPKTQRLSLAVLAYLANAIVLLNMGLLATLALALVGPA